MFSSTFRNAIPSLVTGAALLLVPLAGGLRAQDESPKSISVTAADKEAVARATNVHRHATPANTPKGRSSGRDVLVFGGAAERHRHDQEEDREEGRGEDRKHEVRYEGDVTNLGGAVVYTAEFHPIYLLPGSNCSIATCWGDPGGFLRNLGESDFIHIVDQYVGLSSSRRYTKGISLEKVYTPQATPFTDSDMQMLVYAAALATGLSGYTHIYHIFLPPGQDECFDATFSFCYSPDQPSTFAYCAYHSSVDLPNVGHVLYSVEPYQNIPGCGVPPGTPNGQLVDSTNSTLAHETSEIITDPNGDAWINLYSALLGGAEIADECAFRAVVGENVYSDPLVFQVEGRLFAAQPIYSNERHGCSVH